MDVLIFKPCTLKKRGSYFDLLISICNESIDGYKIHVLRKNKYDETLYDFNRDLHAHFERFHKITTKQELHKLLEKGYTLYDKEKTISDIEKLLGA